VITILLRTIQKHQFFNYLVVGRENENKKKQVESQVLDCKSTTGNYGYKKRKIIERNTEKTNYANKSSSLSDKLPGCGSNRLASSSLRTLEYCTETLRLLNNEMTLARRLEFAAM